MKKYFVGMMLVMSMLISVFTTASAKTVVPLDNGASIIMYSDEEAAQLPSALDVDGSYSLSVPLYPSMDYIRVGGNRNLTLDSSQTTLRVKASEFFPCRVYISIYDVTDAKYTTTGSVSGLQGPLSFARTFDIADLQGGHTYRIGFAATTEYFTSTGTIEAR